MLKLAMVMISVVFVQWTHAAIDPVLFENDVAQQKQYKEMTQILRCPKCQNQSIAESDAPIAQDMRRKVETLIQDGKSNDEIEQFMIARYGDFVTYDPPLKSRTYILWFAPPLFLLMIIMSFFIFFRKSKSS